MHLSLVTETKLRDTTALAERLAALQSGPAQGGGTCTVLAVLTKLRAESPDVAKMLEAAFDDKGTQATGLSTLVRELGYDITAGVIQRHRRRLSGGGGCRCPK